MSYTQRQQQLLTAMGFVPWELRERRSDSVSEVLEHPAAGSSDKQSGELAVQDSIESDTTQDSESAPAFASRPLCSLTNGFSIGHAQAPLLVVVETHDVNVQAPLSGDSAQLFEQMMRSIDVTRGSVCQCAVPVHAREAESGHATVLSLVSPEHAAGLLLCHEIDDNEAASAHAFSLALVGRNALPMWRIPHPDILLTHPYKKRQAWQALKAVRQILRP